MLPNVCLVKNVDQNMAPILCSYSDGCLVSRLELSSSTLDLTAMAPTLSLRCVAQPEAATSSCGAMAVESLILLLDHVTLELLLFLQSFLHPGSITLVFDFTHLGSTFLIQNSQHLDFSPVLCSSSHLDLVILVLAFTHLAFFVSVQSFACLDFSSSPLDAHQPDVSPSAQAFVCFDSSVSFYGAVSLDSWRTETFHLQRIHVRKIYTIRDR